MRGKQILGEEIHTQRESTMLGGILPPVAQAVHRDYIEKVVAESLRKADVKFEDLDAIAVTNRPGLKMSLMVGLRYAKHLSRKYQKPLIPIHHMVRKKNLDNCSTPQKANFSNKRSLYLPFL